LNTLLCVTNSASTKKALRISIKELTVDKKDNKKLKHAIVQLLLYVVAIDDIAMQLSALKVLVTALGKVISLFIQET